ncbi:hypothetical protein K439DRAFT_1075345 [Ramaria rubella]|nr:hypothetical protein K439DRAFT_1075345 [Ramaria rubella]
MWSAVGVEIHMYKLALIIFRAGQPSYYELRVARCALRGARCKVRAARCAVRVAKCGWRKACSGSNNEHGI